MRRDQAIVWIACGVAPLGEQGFVTGLLQLQFENALPFSLTFHVLPFSQKRRLDRHWLNGMDELAGDRRVDTQTAKHHTPP